MHTELTGADIANGKAVCERLAEGNFPLTIALWKYTADSGSWSLQLASPLVTAGDTTGAVGRLESALGSTPAVPFEEISLIPEADPLVVLLTGMFKVNGRLSNSEFNGVEIEDIYVYSDDPVGDMHTELTDEDIANGEALCQRLMEGNFPLTKVLWNYTAALGTWQLWLATPLANDGTGNLGQDRLLPLLGATPEVSLDEILLIPETDPRIVLLSTVYQLEGGPHRNINMNGVQFDEVYVYKNGRRVADPTAA